jgi:hypothetical protein
VTRPLAARVGSLFAVLLASTLASACDRPFQPFKENANGPFSIVGYLDARADTQWVRVMPVRQLLLTGPERIDAVVTLAKVGTGRAVTLRDSVFSFEDPRIHGVAYAHVFWTTERLEAKARYRLSATRSDGATSAAVVDLPDEIEFFFLNQRDTAIVELHAERLLLAETLHLFRTLAGEPGGLGVRRQRTSPPSSPGLYTFAVDGAPLPPERAVDARRLELRIAAARSDWPVEAPPARSTATLPDTMPSNVENGVGFLGGVTTWTIPYHRCTVLAQRPGLRHTCDIPFTARSASVAGRVVRQPCGGPQVLTDVNLVESFEGGGSLNLRWKTGWDGEYRFEGIEPGADLAVHLGPGTPAVRLPRLSPGQRYTAPDISVTGGC